METATDFFQMSVNNQIYQNWFVKFYTGDFTLATLQKCDMQEMQAK